MKLYFTNRKVFRNFNSLIAFSFAIMKITCPSLSLPRASELKHSLAKLDGNWRLTETDDPQNYRPPASKKNLYESHIIAFSAAAVCVMELRRYEWRMAAVWCSKRNSSKSQASGAVKFGESRLVSQFVTVREILRVHQCVSAFSDVDVPVLFCLRSSYNHFSDTGGPYTLIE
jgi:hypothetical protein